MLRANDRFRKDGRQLGSNVLVSESPAIRSELDEGITRRVPGYNRG
jgi:hypothetical protein